MYCCLIGHRGEPARFPENSLCGFHAVLEAGACFIETDVQITRDRVPVLSHDDSLLKITGRDLRVVDTALAEVLALPAGFSMRFGERFSDQHIATLDEFGALLMQWPQARAFVELKSGSIEAFGASDAVDLVLDALGEASGQCIPISFDYAVLEHVRARSDLPVGWVLSEWTDENRRLADALVPEYLFVNRALVSDTVVPLWPGTWCWAVYTANLASDVKRLSAHGFDMIETDDIRDLMRRLKDDEQGFSCRNLK